MSTVTQFTRLRRETVTDIEKRKRSRTVIDKANFIAAGSGRP